MSWPLKQVPFTQDDTPFDTGIFKLDEQQWEA